LADLDNDIKPILESVRKLRLQPPDMDPKKIELVAETELTSLRHQLATELRKDVDAFSGKLALALSTNLVEARKRYEIEIAEARKRRRRWYFTIIGFTGLLGILVFAGYRYLVQKCHRVYLRRSAGACSPI
jgi:hypothetical protein